MDKRIGYMCGTDFDFELEADMGGERDTYPRIYPTKEELLRHRPCVRPRPDSRNDECPIYKVEILRIV